MAILLGDTDLQVNCGDVFAPQTRHLQTNVVKPQHHVAQLIPHLALSN